MLLQTKDVNQLLDISKSVKKNAHSERFKIFLQEQFIDFYEDLLFTDIELFNELMADYLIKYNTLILSSSLLMKTSGQYLLKTSPKL